MRFFLIFSILILFNTSSFAGNGETLKLHVLGMVCEFCVHSILKVFEDQGADSIDIDLNAGIVTIYMQEGKTLTDEAIEKLIEYGGYDLEKIDRLKS